MHINIYDSEEIYCRKLGHHLKFGYCRVESSELPCSRISKCWSGKLPVNEFLDRYFTSEQLKAIFTPPVPKITSLIELIQKAQTLKG
jgi:hypothetical protein